MKNICLLTLTLLIVSSCGLFKKTVRTKESAAVDVQSRTTLRSSSDVKTQHRQTLSSQSISLIKGADRLQIEGDKIQIAENGTIQVEKGKVIRKSIQRSNAMSNVDQTVSDQRQQKVEKTGHEEQKLKGREQRTTKISRPTSTTIVCFLIGLALLAFLLKWRINRKS